MPEKAPHISLALDRLAPRVLSISLDELASWPEDARDLAASLAAELFLVRYNPFIDPEEVRESVKKRLGGVKRVSWGDYADILKKAVDVYWDEFDKDMAFKEKLIERLRRFMPEDGIIQSPNSLVENSTDATDLRMALPLLVLAPGETAEVQGILRLANEMGFAVVPRGGGSGLTGGSVPVRRRTVILSMQKFKKILEIDVERKFMCTQTGVITLNAIKAAGKEGLLFTVDPASKAASSIGGNLSENAGGPFAFEYGTTLDNILSYKMVLPSGDLVEVVRRDHPRHKIMPEETAVFDIFDASGAKKDEVILPGDQIRGAGLGKDVSNKYLGGLPGIQKEGVDGVITEGCFVLYDKPKLSRTLCLEFFGRSMHNAMLVIGDVVALRNRIREEGDAVKISALEEFGPKYVKAISYAKKSTQYEGEPISVLLLQLDSDDADALNEAADDIIGIAMPYDNVDIFAARDDKEAEFFWEDRHKLSAISKRTSGFKINEDIVIPLDVIPIFSDFLEELNLFNIARAYKRALQNVNRLYGVSPSDEFISMEMEFADRIMRKKITAKDFTDDEVEVQTYFFFQDLASRYPRQKEPLRGIYEDMLATRIEVANHMHAGDGNCHVNIPVNSNDPDMMRRAMESADKVFERVTELGGAVSGEHGIGITKIAFLHEDKIAALRAYKETVDPNNVLNPGKLVTRNLEVEPYTFSFNRLIRDLKKTALPEKDRLMAMLANIQTCTRCGKCKQVCPMYYPEKGLLFHPRNKNISLGALIEALYYSQINRGEPAPELLEKLRDLMDHCTACGKCAAACPVKIQTPKVALDMRSFLEQKGAGGHPYKTKILRYLAEDPSKRVPKTAKYMAYGQTLQSRAVSLIPKSLRGRFQSPVLQGPNPQIGFVALRDRLRLDKGSFFQPKQSLILSETVFYFPGCGAGLFHNSIGMAALHLLLKAGVGVVMPDIHMCCGYPLSVSGLADAFESNRQRNLETLRALFVRAADAGMTPSYILTSCGTCREALESYDFIAAGADLKRMDVSQFLLDRMPPVEEKHDAYGDNLLYHAACHAEWAGIPAAKATEAYRAALTNLTGASAEISPECCGESGLGALTSPHIYNVLRERKRQVLEKELVGENANRPIIVGCPSCKIGIKRTLINMNRKNPVLHSLEFLAERIDGPQWQKILKKEIKDGIRKTPAKTDAAG